MARLSFTKDYKVSKRLGVSFITLDLSVHAVESNFCGHLHGQVSSNQVPTFQDTKKQSVQLSAKEAPKKGRLAEVPSTSSREALVAFITRSRYLSLLQVYIYSQSALLKAQGAKRKAASFSLYNICIVYTSSERSEKNLAEESDDSHCTAENSENGKEAKEGEESLGVALPRLTNPSLIIFTSGKIELNRAALRTYERNLRYGASVARRNVIPFVTMLMSRESHPSKLQMAEATLLCSALLCSYFCYLLPCLKTRAPPILLLSLLASFYCASLYYTELLRDFRLKLSAITLPPLELQIEFAENGFECLSIGWLERVCRARADAQRDEQQCLN